MSAVDFEAEDRGTRYEARGEIGRNASSVRNGTMATETENETQAMATATENDLRAWEELNAEHAAEQAAMTKNIALQTGESKADIEAKISSVQETLSPLKLAIEGQASARGEDQKRSDRKLFAILDEVEALHETILDAVSDGNDELCADLRRALTEENAAILAAVQEQKKVSAEQQAAMKDIALQTRASKDDLEAKISGVQEMLSSLKLAIEWQAKPSKEEKMSDEMLKAILAGMKLSHREERSDPCRDARADESHSRAESSDPRSELIAEEEGS